MLIHLVQGFFFQDQPHVGLGMGGRGEGVVAVFTNAKCRFMFAGVIHPDETTSTNTLTGELSDHFGTSTLTDVRLTISELSFNKRYDGRQYGIHYTFYRRGAIWVGEYFHEATGGGVANCIITVCDSFQMLSPCPA